MPIDAVEVDDEAQARRISDATGIPIEQTRGYATFGEAVRGGWFEVVSDDYEALTGRGPQSLGEYLGAVETDPGN